MNIVILTKKYGKNYNGATLTTQYLVSNWNKKVNSITVFAMELGVYDDYENLEVIKESFEPALAMQIRKYARTHKDSIYYSDDHLGYILSTLGVNYYHTYHGNWPDVRYKNPEFFLKSFYFMPLYSRAISKAKCVINVSKYMEYYTKRYNPDSVVIRNGLDIKMSPDGTKIDKAVLLVGNVDSRKYAKLVKIANHIYEVDPEISFDIYGNLENTKLVNKLSKLPNIRMKGQVSDIPYRNYRLYLSVSQMENLSLSACEAIYNKVPVYCFDVGGLKEVVTSHNGLVIDRNNDSGMVDAIIAFFNDGLTYCMDDSVLNDFNWGTASHKYLKLFGEG